MIGIQDGGNAVFENLGNLLLEIIRNDKYKNEAIIYEAIYEEAINTFVSGFILFKKQSNDQLSFLLSLFAEAKTNENIKKLLHTLLRYDLPHSSR